MTTKAELEQQLTSLQSEVHNLRERIDAMPDDEPERWEPVGGDWFIASRGRVSDTFPSTHEERCAGSESQTRKQAEAKSKARIARERLQTWVDEEGEGGHYTVMPAGEGKWRPVQMSWPMPWDVMMSESTARRAAELLTRGVIRLEVE